MIKTKKEISLIFNKTIGTTLIWVGLNCLFYTNNLIAQTSLFTKLATQQTGVTFANKVDETENLNVLAYEYFYNGGAVAVGDINNDGLQDLFFTANMQPSKLYLNLGGMKFKDITAEAGVEGRKNSWKTGATFADVNGDGLTDLYVCYSGKVPEAQRKNELYINKGNLKFGESAEEYGLADLSYSTQAAFFDMDNDGDLDMFLLNHSTKKIDNLELAKYRVQTDALAGSKLFENTGKKFIEISEKAGIHQFPLTFGLGIAIADINKDGWEDIYVTNDYNEPDYLYINNKNGTFSDDTKKSLNHLSEFSMGVDIADFNNDALPDIITLDMLPETNRRQKLLQLQENYENFDIMLQQDLQKQYMRNMLQLNNGDGSFSEIAQFSGVSNTDWSWCPLLADFDNDGFKDLFVTNGYLRDYTNKDFLKYWGDYKLRKLIDREPVELMQLIKSMPVTMLKNYMFKNEHDLKFSNQSSAWGFQEEILSNGCVYADLDNDGDLDLIVNNLNQEASIYQNNANASSNNRFLTIKLTYKTPNLFAIGAKVQLYCGKEIQYQELNPNKGYLSCLPTTLSFGLGGFDKVDSLKITWPDQTITIQKNIRSNQTLNIAYAEKNKVSETRPTPEKSVFRGTTGPIPYTHQTFAENDFKRQLLMLFMYSKTGPVIAKADVNKDGLEDLFLSGDTAHPATLYFQKPNGSFQQQPNLAIGDEYSSALTAAAFADVNGDGWPDLYLAKGGYSLFEQNTASLQDELYLNDKAGNLYAAPAEFLPNTSASSKSCIRPCDYDNDGDMDFFVGGRIIPGEYPKAPQSYLLNNNGKGQFSRVTTNFDNPGMVTDAQWLDVNEDGRKDLLLCGEMMPVSVFVNTAAGFENRTAQYFTQPESGFWFSLTLADVNGDGRQDLIAGNLGENSQIRISPQKPAVLHYADFDNNGSIDPLLEFYIQDSSFPFISRDEINEQMYGMRKRFTSYQAYANTTITKLLTAEEFKKAGNLSATESRTVCFLNINGKFEKNILPAQAQFSAITQSLAEDFNHDGFTDLLLLGNRMDNRLKIGSIDANFGCLLAGDGRGGFSYLPQTQSGLSVTGDVKSSSIITINGRKHLIIGINGYGLQFYELQ